MPVQVSEYQTTLLVFPEMKLKQDRFPELVTVIVFNYLQEMQVFTKFRTDKNKLYSQCTGLISCMTLKKGTMLVF
jgi:hypothetical protein